MIDSDLLVQAIQAAEHGVYVSDPEGVFQYVNPGFCRITGYTESELVGSPVSILKSGEMPRSYYQGLWSTIRTGARWQEEITNRRKDGSLYTAFQIITPVFSGDTIIAYAGIQHDITDAKEMREKLSRSVLEFDAIFSNTQDAIFLVSLDGEAFRYQRLSRSHEILTGLSSDDVVGKTPTEVFGTGHGSIVRSEFQRCLESRAPITFEETITVAGEKKTLETKLSPIIENGVVVQLVGSSRDITKQKHFEEELRYLAEMDVLTNIPNRRKISDELDRELARAQRHGHALAVLLIDVDHFKRVNDELGHETGDAALRGIAATLQATLRPSDRVGRWGGEEFVVVLPETDHDGALIVAERVRAGIENARILLDRIITVSIGVSAMQPIDTAKPGGLAHSPESLLRIADEELYRAKEEGRNRICG